MANTMFDRQVEDVVRYPHMSEDTDGFMEDTASESGEMDTTMAEGRLGGVD